MLELLGSLLGFAASAFPSVLGFFQDGKDKKHELELQDRLAKAGVEQASIEGETARAILELKADIASTKGAHAAPVLTGIGWVDAYRSSVRPTVTYWFMALYSYSKYEAFIHGAQMWTQWDQTLLATVISFWFGDRLIRRVTNGNR